MRVTTIQVTKEIMRAQIKDLSSLTTTKTFAIATSINIVAIIATSKLIVSLIAHTSTRISVSTIESFTKQK